MKINQTSTEDSVSRVSSLFVCHPSVSKKLQWPYDVIRDYAENIFTEGVCKAKNKRCTKRREGSRRHLKKEAIANGRVHGYLIQLKSFSPTSIEFYYDVDMKQTVTVTWRSSTSITFSNTEDSKKSDFGIKIQNYISAELRKNKTITYMFECLSSSLPIIQRIENWIRDSTSFQLRNFYDTLKRFSQSNSLTEARGTRGSGGSGGSEGEGNQAGDADFFPMNPGDVVLIPRSAIHVRLVFFSKYAFDLKFPTADMVLLEDVGLHTTVSEHLRISRTVFRNFCMHLRFKHPTINLLFPNQQSAANANQGIFVGFAFQSELLEVVLKKMHRFLGSFFLFSSFVDRKDLHHKSFQVEHDEQRISIKPANGRHIFRLSIVDWSSLLLGVDEEVTNGSNGMNATAGSGISNPEIVFLQTVYFPKRIISPPYSWETLVSFISILALPNEVFKDLVGVIKLESKMMFGNSRSTEPKRIQFEINWGMSTVVVGDDHLSLKILVHLDEQPVVELPILLNFTSTGAPDKVTAWENTSEPIRKLTMSIIASTWRSKTQPLTQIMTGLLGLTSLLLDFQEKEKK
eukprot:TRINITY_DN4432_c0_g2_i1.p1 TRINITY_DN4432_c0_g2~~TRINITY_DN4432_c0_g2_i1.p1  ORF type:complete len:572 (-),score=66.02 TRINITY_DN4432_c0_g2_i1:58-1773(-)